MKLILGYEQTSGRTQIVRIVCPLAAENQKLLTQWNGGGQGRISGWIEAVQWCASQITQKSSLSPQTQPQLNPSCHSSENFWFCRCRIVLVSLWLMVLHEINFSQDSIFLRTKHASFYAKVVSYKPHYNLSNIGGYVGHNVVVCKNVVPNFLRHIYSSSPLIHICDHLRVINDLKHNMTSNV